MTKDEIRALVCDLLGAIAPEADLGLLTGGEDLREELDIDSMDFLNFITALHEQTGVDIPEKDYAGLVSLDDIISYITRAML